MNGEYFKKAEKWLLQEKYKGKLTEEAQKDIEKLRKGELVDYLIGFSNFLGCKINLSLRPFIPEAESEYWAEKAIEEILEQKKKLRVLDIFSGSGCLGIAVLKKVKKSKVDFGEIDKNFLKQIKINLDLNKIKSSRYKIIPSNIFENIKGKYDYILANPPYIARKRIYRVQKSVLDFEPKKALFGKEDGLFYIRKFLKEAGKHLQENGKIFMEFDSWQRKEIEKILKKYNYKKYKFQKDQYEKWRYVEINN